MFKKILNFFDKLEDRVRASLSHHPVPYSIIAGIAIVVFWRGVWEIMDAIPGSGGMLGGIVTIIISVVVMLITGLLVSFFIGDTIIISGIKGEKKTVEKTETELKQEEGEVKKLGEEIRDELSDLKKVEAKLDVIEKKVEKIEEDLK